MKKKWLLVLSFLLTLPLVMAGGGVLDVFKGVWDKIIKLGNLTWLTTPANAVVGLTRILIGILVFAIFYAVLASFSGKEDASLGFLKKNHALVIAAILAIISAIFLPAEVLLAVGAGWGTAVAFLLIGGPIVGLGFLLWRFPGTEEGDTKVTVFFKFLLCLLMFWILTAMKYHIEKIAPGF